MTYTQDDWHGRLCALAHCWRAVDGQAHDRCDTLEALKAGTLPEVVMDCAFALGLHKRRSFQWERLTDRSARTLDRDFHSGGWQQQANGTHVAWVWPFPPQPPTVVKVEGHTTKEAAIEHLSWVLGSREHYAKTHT